MPPLKDITESKRHYRKKVKQTFKKVKIINKKKPKRKNPALFLMRFSLIQRQDNKLNLKVQSMRI